MSCARIEDLELRVAKLEKMMIELRKITGADNTDSIERGRRAQARVDKNPEDAVALYVMYCHFKYGWGDTPKDEEAALIYLNRAATLGYAPACVDYAQHLIRYSPSNCKSPINYNQAIEILSAAENKTPPQEWIDEQLTSMSYDEHLNAVKKLKKIVS